MTLRELHPGDEIEANVRGYLFPALVEDLDDELIDGKPVRVRPLVPNCTYTRLTARQVRRRLRRGPQMELLA